MGEAERLREETLRLILGFAERFIGAPPSPEIVAETAELLDALLGAVRAKERGLRDQEWLDHAVVDLEPHSATVRLPHAELMRMVQQPAHRMGYQWRDGAWRKVEEGGDAE